MRLTNQQSADNQIIVLHDENWLKQQRYAGKVLAKTLLLLERLVQDRTAKSLLELDSIAEEFIRNNGCTPTFKNYHGFPNACCISHGDNALVHGIPKDVKLIDGDMVRFDLGTTYGDAIADSAITCIFGEPKSSRHVDIINVTKKCLDNAIKAIVPGKRLGVIGRAIYTTARDGGYKVIEQYGGHGIEGVVNGVDVPHAAPFVSNKSTPEEGVRLRAGMSLAIEPLLTIGGTETTVDDDGWTVRTKELNAHFEHSIFIHEDGNVEITTDRSSL